MKNKNLLIAIYNHPEGYPPTLNALGELDSLFNTVEVIYRPLLPTEWHYKANISLYPAGEEMTVRQQTLLSLPKKISLFYQFRKFLLNRIRISKPDVVLLYDPLAMLAYHSIRPLVKGNPIVWYHNHDVIDMAYTRKYSFAYWAVKAEQQAMGYLDIFSLPTQERLSYFQKCLPEKTFIIPNYPSSKGYARIPIAHAREASTLSLIYQGSLSPNHGIEELLPLLGRKIGERQLRMTLIGNIKESYKTALLSLAAEVNTSAYFTILPPVLYSELPYETVKHHIGIAIHHGTDIMYQTGGTASNKIYEYAALGLPILYYNSPAYIARLGGFTWAFPVDVTEESLINALTSIAAQYDTLSVAANASFNESLNFEAAFAPAKEHLLKLLAERGK